MVLAFLLGVLVILIAGALVDSGWSDLKSFAVLVWGDVVASVSK